MLIKKFILISLLVMSWLYSQEEVGNDEFYKGIAQGISIVYFNAEWNNSNDILDTLETIGDYEQSTLYYIDINNNLELKEKYKVQCGTPWFINTDTGKGFCGFREKDMIEKWLNGEDIPAPPRPKSPMPRPPFYGAKKKEEKEWKKEYKKWSEENSHLPNLRTVDELLAQPRPKSMPPQPWPNPTSTDKEIADWKRKYDKWLKNNTHLPNTIPSEQIIERMKNQPPPGGPPGGPPGRPPMQGNLQLENRIQSIETKLNKLMNHLGVK